MDSTVAAIAEFVKLGIIVYINYLRQAGLTEEQVDAIYQEAKKGMLARNPANLP